MREVAKRAINGMLQPTGLMVVNRDRGKHREYRMVEPVLHSLAAGLDRPLRIVQIGANDGRRDDPLADFIAAGVRLEALLIEPHPYPFSILEKRYRDDPRITVANVAIGSPGTMRLYALTEDQRANYENAVGRRPDEISSSDPEHLVSRIVERLAVTPDEARDMIVEVDVRFLSLSQVLGETSFSTEFDVLQIDAEGFDDLIIRSLDLSRHQILVINYEQKNLPPDRYMTLAKHLRNNGFANFRDRADECAIRVPPQVGQGP